MRGFQLAHPCGALGVSGDLLGFDHLHSKHFPVRQTERHRGVCGSVPGLPGAVQMLKGCRGVAEGEESATEGGMARADGQRADVIHDLAQARHPLAHLPLLGFDGMQRRHLRGAEQPFHVAGLLPQSLREFGLPARAPVSPRAPSA
jgi:hypothetical protein